MILELLFSVHALAAPISVYDDKVSNVTFEMTPDEHMITFSSHSKVVSHFEPEDASSPVAEYKIFELEPTKQRVLATRWLVGQSEMIVLFDITKLGAGVAPRAVTHLSAGPSSFALSNDKRSITMTVTERKGSGPDATSQAKLLQFP